VENEFKLHLQYKIQENTIMTNKQTTIDDDTWLGTLNGTIKPSANNPEQMQIARIRNYLLDQEVKELIDNPPEISKELAEKYQKEQDSLLIKLRKENVITSQKKTPNLIQTFTNFIAKHKFVIAPVAFASVLGVTVLPILLNQYTNTSQIAYKGIEESRPVITLTNQPQLTATRIKKEFEAVGLSVDLKQTEKGWLLTTELPVPIFKHQNVIAVMKNNNIAAAIGSNLLTLLFIKK